MTYQAERRASVLTDKDKEWIIQQLEKAVQKHVERQVSILTENDRQFILKEITETIRVHGCILPESEKDAVRMWYGLLTDIGDGDIKAGVRRTRDFFGFISNMYNKKNVLSGLIFGGFCLAVIGWLIKIAATGLLEYFKRG